MARMMHPETRLIHAWQSVTAIDLPEGLTDGRLATMADGPRNRPQFYLRLAMGDAHKADVDGVRAHASVAGYDVDPANRKDESK